MEKADHSGHRSRLRNKYAEFGIEALEPHEVLEMLLYNAVPYRNTNDIAKRLLDAFGSLGAVFDASVDMLTDEGLTRNQALYLKLIPDVTRLYSLDKYINPVKLVDTESIADYVIDQFIGIEGRERVILMLFDTKGKLLFCGILSEGEFDSAPVPIRKIMRLVMNYNAASVVLAHNHPSGFAMPSLKDVEATRAIMTSLKNVGVKLIDHYVVADNDAVSMAMSNLLR